MFYSANRKYNLIRKLSTEQLEQLLAQDFDLYKESGTENNEYVLQILEVLEEREKSQSPNHLSDVDEAWKEFHTRYNGADSSDQSLFADILTDGHVGREKSRKQRRVFSKHQIVAAIISILMLAMMIPAALGCNLMEIIGQWTATNFSFNYGTYKKPDLENNSYASDQIFDNLQQALDYYDIQAIKEPVNIPNGFVQDSISAAANEKSTSVDAYYICEDKTIAINITKFTEPRKYIYEKDETTVEKYYVNNICHYIFQNNGRVIATWAIEGIEASIHGDISVESMKELINSMCRK